MPLLLRPSLPPSLSSCSSFLPPAAAVGTLRNPAEKYRASADSLPSSTHSVRDVFFPPSSPGEGRPPPRQQRRHTRAAPCRPPAPSPAGPPRGTRAAARPPRGPRAAAGPSPGAGPRPGCCRRATARSRSRRGGRGASGIELFSRRATPEVSSFFIRFTTKFEMV